MPPLLRDSVQESPSALAKKKAAPLLGGLEEGDAAATLECLYCPPTSRSHFQHLFVFEGLCLCTWEG